MGTIDRGTALGKISCVEAVESTFFACEGNVVKLHGFFVFDIAIIVLLVLDVKRATCWQFNGGQVPRRLIRGTGVLIGIGYLVVGIIG